MSKMKQLNDFLTELEGVFSQGLAIVEESKKLLSDEDKVAEQKTTPESPKEIKLEDLRAVLATKARDGYKDDIRALLNKYGASSLSALDKEHYSAVLEEAGGIGND